MKKVTNQMIFDHIRSLDLSKKSKDFIDGCDAQAIVDLFDLNTTNEDIESVADELKSL